MKLGRLVVGVQLEFIQSRLGIMFDLIHLPNFLFKQLFNISDSGQLSTDDGLCVYFVKETPSNLLHGKQ